MAEPTSAQKIEQVMRTYIQACNNADAKAIVACFCRDAVHYAPAAPGRRSNSAQQLIA